MSNLKRLDLVTFVGESVKIFRSLVVSENPSGGQMAMLNKLQKFLYIYVASHEKCRVSLETGKFEKIQPHEFSAMLEKLSGITLDFINDASNARIEILTCGMAGTSLSYPGIDEELENAAWYAIRQLEHPSIEYLLSICSTSLISSLGVSVELDSLNTEIFVDPERTTNALKAKLEIFGCVTSLELEPQEWRSTIRSGCPNITEIGKLVLTALSPYINRHI